jgi:hypothetical protein
MQENEPVQRRALLRAARLALRYLRSWRLVMGCRIHPRQSHSQSHSCGFQ